MNTFYTTFFALYNFLFCFSWVTISDAPKNTKTKKNLEVSYIALWTPDLDKKKDFKRLVLIRNGVT